MHGDIDKARQALKVAAVIDESDNWIGGKTVVVQVGDQLDRGDDEIALLLLLERLRHQASVAGGALHVINGNHETLNVYGRFRYATKGGFRDFLRWRYWYSLGQKWKRACDIPAPDLSPPGKTDDAAAWSVFFPLPAFFFMHPLNVFCHPPM